MWFGVLALCLLLAGTAAAEEFGITCPAGNDGEAAVVPSEADGETYLFLPSSLTPQAVALTFDVDGVLTAQGDEGCSLTFVSGETWDLTTLFNEEPQNGQYRVTLTAENGVCEAITMMFSANLRSLFLVSDDPDHEGRAWVDGSEDHETCASGNLTVLGADGSLSYEGAYTKLRGRGNTTWGNYPLTYTTKTTVDKKPYQITLANEADLLDTGDEDEANKRWVLLAEYYDGTMLHNRVSYDLARELGQESAPRCASVDLYYDGEYCGQYLLTEKIEVAAGRVEIEDYDSILKTVNHRLGINIKSLPQITQRGGNGEKLAATDGVTDGGTTALGGYLIELDNAYYNEERAYFGLTDGTFYTVTNPEYASLSMVEYLSGLFEEIDETLANYGVNPDTGQCWTDGLDADSLLPYYWVNKLAKNPDTWKTSSTYFVLPAGSKRLSMGPVWDFDQSYYLRTQEDLSVADPLTLGTAENSWAYDLERIPSFQTLAKAFFTQKLVPAVTDILLGDADAQGVYLHSLSWYWQETEASRRMNDVLWNPVSLFGTVVADTYEENYRNFRSFLEERLAWLTEDVAVWPESTPAEEIAVTLTAPYGNVEGRLKVTLDDLHNCVEQPCVQLALIAEATDETYAVWQADVTVQPKPGTAIAENARVTVNGTAIACTCNKDGSVTACVRFEDPSYRTAEYEDMDYGLVFNAEYYAERYPDIVAEVGDDPEALLAYYVNNGIAEFQAANTFFDPAEALAKVPDIADLYGDEGEGVVDYFLDGGYVDLMSTLDKCFTPAVWEAEP